MKIGKFFIICVGVLLILTHCKPSDNQAARQESENMTVIAAIGDSITYGARSLKGGYPAMLEAKLRAAGHDVKVVNQGISGEKAYQTDERFLNAVKDADVVLLMIGFNDLTKPGQCPEPHNCRTLEHIADMLDKALVSKKIPFVSTVTPAQAGNIRDRANPAIRNLNELIVDIAAARDVAVVDNHRAILENGGKSLFSDHAHPNDRGYEIIAEQWYNALIRSNKERNVLSGNN